MSRRSAIATGTLMLVLLSACSSGDDLPDETGAADGDGGGDGELVTADRIGNADAANVFSMQMTQGHSAESPTPEWADGFREVLTQWAEDNPDWRAEITVTPAASTTQDQTKLLESVRAGRGPDCAEIDSAILPQFMDQGSLQPVTDLYGDGGLDDLFPFVRDVVVADDGEAYAYWWNTDLRVLYRRTDLVPEAPATWAEVQASAKAAAESAGVDGILVNGGRWEGTTFDWYSTLWGQGGALVDESGVPVFGEGANREAAVDGLEYFQGLVESGAAPQRVATIMSYDDFLPAAQSDSVAMFIGGHWQYQQLNDVLDDDQFALWEVSEIPGEEAGQTATGTGGWTVGVFTEDEEKAQACKDFIEAVYAGPANEITGQIPTSMSLFDELDAFSAPVFEKFRTYLENGQARPGSPSYGAISAALQVAVSDVLSGSATPEDAIDQAFETALRETE